MRFFNLPHACLLLLASCLSQETLAKSNDFPHAHRVLRAATKRSDLYRRSMRISKKFSTQLAYIENENGWNNKKTFASEVRIASAKPVLNLEEIEHHLKDVYCSDGRITLDFVDTSSARDAFHACHGESGGLIITSHESCNAHGERIVYKVHDVAFVKDGEALSLSVTQSLWQDAFDSVDISFGHTTEDHLFRRHSDFAKVRGKRQSIDIPSNISNSSTNVTFPLSSQFIGTTFSAESFFGGLEQLVPLPQPPIEMGCNNCTTTGNIVLTQGAFNVDTKQIDLVPDFLQGVDDGKEISNVITSGFFELAANDLSAHLDLFAKPKASGSFEIDLFTLPVLGFVIPGIGKAGAVFEPKITADFEISGGFELNYGIEVTIPNDSKIRLELSDLTKSKANGFPGSTLTPLPFKTNATGIDVVLGLGFKPTIPIGFEFAGKVTAEVSVSMNLPRLSAKLSTNTPANCGNSTNNSTLTKPYYVNRTTTAPGNLPKLGPLVLVEANVSVTIDTGLAVDLPLPPPFGNVTVEAEIFSTSFPLVTACAALQDAFKDLTSVVPAPPSTTYSNASLIASPTPSPSPYNNPPYPYLNSTLVQTIIGTTVVTKTKTIHRHSSTGTAVYTHEMPTHTQGMPAYSQGMPAYSQSIPTHTQRNHTQSQHVPAYSKSMVSPTPSLTSTYGKGPDIPIETFTPLPPLLESHSTSKLGHSVSYMPGYLPAPSSQPIVNQTTPATTAVIGTTPPVASVGTIVMSTGYLRPSYYSIGPLRQQTGLPVYTGAAAAARETPSLDLGGMGWQVGIICASLVLGALVL